MASAENVVALYMAAVDSDPKEEKANIDELSRRTIPILRRKLIQGIQARQLKLLDFVRILGEHLTNEDSNHRKHALGCLSEVISSFPPRTMNIQEVDVMTTFYCDRMEDDVSTKENIAGLTALQMMPGFGEEEVTKVCNALFNDVEMTRQLQPTRYAIFTLIDSMMKKQRKALKKLGKVFIEGFVGLMTNEKDPRNLMLAFSIVKVILIEFDIVTLQEKLFDAVFCYFPITFKARPDDIYGITTDDLKLRLRECISATHYFAPDSIPQLLDKMNSSSPVVKIDTLQTLTACANNYGPQTIANYATSIWDTIRFEILNANDEDVSSQALDLLRAITATLSFGLSGEAPRTSALAIFLKHIVETCSKELRDIEAKMARPAGKVLSTCSSVSAPSNKFIVERCIPQLIMLFRETDSTNKRTAILDVLNGFLDATKEVFGEIKDVEEVPIMLCKDDLFEVYSKGFLGSGSEETTYKITALQGFKKLLALKGILSNNEIGIVVQYFDDVVLRDENEETCEKVLAALAELAKTKPQLILDISFPAFLAELPDSESVEKREGSVRQRKGYKTILAGLAQISSERVIFEVLLRRLFSKLDIVLSNSTMSITYPHAILGTIFLVIQKKSSTKDADLPSYIDNLVPMLLNKIVVPATIPGPKTKILCSREVLHVVALIVNAIVREGDLRQQNLFYRELFKLFVTGEPSTLVSSHQEKVVTQFRPLLPEAEIQQAETVQVFVFAVAAMRKHATLPVADINNLLLQVAKLVTSSRNDPRRQSLLKMIACVLNKQNDDSNISPFVDQVVFDLWTSESDHNRRTETLELQSWIAKALVLRTNTRGYELVQLLIDLLPDEKWGLDAARAFQVITSEDDLLNKSNHAVIRLLYKQRFFAFVFPKLLGHASQSGDSGLRSNYLIALSNIIANIPKEILLPELPSLLPLLLQSLDLKSPVLRANAINTLYVMVMESPEIISTQIESMIPALLTQIEKSPSNTPNVRISSLRCLAILPTHLPFESIDPFQKQVVRALGAVLDDPKRQVRKEAVDCRHAWYTSSGKLS